MRHAKSEVLETSTVVADDTCCSGGLENAGVAGFVLSHPPMILFAWNFRGIGYPLAIQILRNLFISQLPEVMFLSEVKCAKEDKVCGLVKFLGFSDLEFVPATGHSGGLLFCWKSNTHIQIVFANNNIINSIIQQT